MDALVEFDPSCEALIFTPQGEPIHGKTREQTDSAFPDPCLRSHHWRSSQLQGWRPW